MAQPAFVYGSPISPSRPDLFCDRIEELATVRSALTTGANVILLAPRRYGKTSVLNRAVMEASASGARVGRVSLIDCTDIRDVCEIILTGILTGPGAARERGLDAVWNAVRRLRPTLGLHSDGSVDVALDVTADAAGWRRLLGDTLRVLKDLAGEGEAQVGLVIDEFQRAYELDDNVPGIIKRLCDDMPEVSLILSGSRRHVMANLAGKGGPLARVGATVALERIPEAEMVDFLCRRATNVGKLLNHDVATTIYRRANGVPNEVQHLAHEAVGAARTNRIGAAAVDEAVQRIIRQARFEYISLYRGLSPAQQRLLRHLAHHGPIARLQTGEIARVLRVANPSAVKRALTVLERDDIVEQTLHGYDVANPFLAEWLRFHVAEE